METKEAVEFIEIEKRIICGCATQCLEAKGFNKVITLLKQGEKYKQMWEKSKKDLLHASVENWKVSLEQIILEIKKLEEKHFPKESKKDIETSGHFFVDQYFKEKEAKQDYPESEE